MSEHTYRLVIGTTLLVLLYTEFYVLAYIIVAMTLFEGVTNLRLNIVVTQLRKKMGHKFSQLPEDFTQHRSYRVPFDAERAQRLFIAISFSIIFFALPNEFWILNWFFAFGMLISGIVMFCPVIAIFRAVGFR